MAAREPVATAQVRGSASDTPTHTANDSVEPAATSSRTVDIFVIGKGDELGKMQRALGPRAFAPSTVRWSSLAKFDSNALFQRAAGDAGVAVRAWVDLSAPTIAHVYFANRAGERFLVRELLLSPASEDVNREALAQVLELSVAALLEDARAGLSRKEAESVLAAQAQGSGEHASSGATDRESSPLERKEQEVALTDAAHARTVAPTLSTPPAFEATVFYAGSAFAAAVPIVHGPGVALAWSVGTDAPRIAFFASGQYHLPATLEGNQIGVELEAAVLRGGVELSLPTTATGAARTLGRTFVAARLGLGGDVTRVTPLPGALDSSASLAAPYSSSEFAFMAAFGITTALTNRIDLSTGALLDFYVSKASYDLRAASNVSTVLAPRPLRPGLVAGLVFK